MRTLYSTVGMLLFALVAGISCGTSQAQQAGQDVSGLIEAKRYVFVAQSANPMGGRFRQLNTGEYDVRVSPDSVVSFLPFFGRAYSAPIDPSSSGIQFTSTNFEYRQTPRKKGGWNIVIEPKDAQDVRQLT
ncbi:MAG TPA: DUF4251 domain-containing protein, partial [Chitinophagaceae bacterium]|nr:DUF4251 domain-containing protein [Chitinophagaceae bacterium]